MNDLEHFFYNKPHRVCQKWRHYFAVYERYFAKFRNRSDLKMLEIGVSQGGSLQMWRDYFGPSALIVGVDISEHCRNFAEGNTHVRIGSQSDRGFLRGIVAEFGDFDIVLDDGGHKMDQQIISFEELYHHVHLGGVYLVEDCHTSYQAEFDGGIRKHDSFIEFAKRKVDEINGRHIHTFPSEFVTPITTSTLSVAFYESMVVFERDVTAPVEMVEAGGSASGGWESSF